MKKSQMKKFTLITIISLLSLTLINTSGRILQKVEDDSCSKVQATNNTDCYNSSANSVEDNCCAISILGRKMCKNFKKDSEVYKAFGGIDTMKVYLTTNIMGSALVECNEKNPISEDVKTVANNCGNYNNPSVEACNALSNENIQCCFTETTTKALGKLNACAGVVAPVKLPSFTMKNDGDYNSLMCGVNSEEVITLNACAAVLPVNEADCTKLSKGDIECKFATYDKDGLRAKMCMGKKGDMEMMLNLGIEPRLRGISFNQLASEVDGVERFGFSVGLLFFLIFLF